MDEAEQVFDGKESVVLEKEVVLVDILNDEDFLHVLANDETKSEIPKQADDLAAAIETKKRKEREKAEDAQIAKEIDEADQFLDSEEKENSVDQEFVDATNFLIALSKDQSNPNVAKEAVETFVNIHAKFTEEKQKALEAELNKEAATVEPLYDAKDTDLELLDDADFQNALADGASNSKLKK